MMKLQRYIPAVLDTEAGIPFESKAATIFLIGMVARYAVGPFGSIGASRGLDPEASGIEKSATFTATRSTERSIRPGASPRLRTSLG